MRSSDDTHRSRSPKRYGDADRSTGCQTNGRDKFIRRLQFWERSDGAVLHDLRFLKTLPFSLSHPDDDRKSEQRRFRGAGLMREPRLELMGNSRTVKTRLVPVRDDSYRSLPIVSAGRKINRIVLTEKAVTA